MQQLRHRLAGCRVAFTIEYDDALEEDVLRVDGRDGIARRAWGTYMAGIEDGPMFPHGYWIAHNEDGQRAHSDTGDLNEFAHWWHISD